MAMWMRERQDRWRIAPIVALVWGLGGCAAPEDTPGSPEIGTSVEAPAPAAEPPPPAPEDVLPGPAVSVDTILIEGTPEEIQVRRVAPEAGFPLPFVTRIPDDMRVNPISSGEADAVRFEAAFGGVHNPDAYLSLYVPSGGRVEALADQLGAVEDETRRFGWSSQEYRLEGERAGFLVEGEREGRVFYLILAYPPEYGDGIGPRVDLILRNWRWADGSPLGG